MPKGVVLTHINFVSVIASAIAQGTILPRPTDIVIAYLPLAHILELLVEVRLVDEEHPQLILAHFNAADSTDIMRVHARADLPIVVSGMLVDRELFIDPVCNL